MGHALKRRWVVAAMGVVVVTGCSSAKDVDATKSDIRGSSPTASAPVQRTVAELVIAMKERAAAHDSVVVSADTSEAGESSQSYRLASNYPEPLTEVNLALSQGESGLQLIIVDGKAYFHDSTQAGNPARWSAVTTQAALGILQGLTPSGIFDRLEMAKSIAPKGFDRMGADQVAVYTLVLDTRALAKLSEWKEAELPPEVTMEVRVSPEGDLRKATIQIDDVLAESEYLWGIDTGAVAPPAEYID